MPKPFRFDPEKFLASKFSGASAEESQRGPRGRAGKAQRPGMPPTMRGLPWSKMLRSFREKSA